MKVITQMSFFLRPPATFSGLWVWGDRDHPPFRLLSLGPTHCVSAPSKTHAHRGTALAPLLVPLNLRLAENPTASRGWEGMLG